MSTEVLTQTLGAGGTAVFGAGTMFLLASAPAGAVNIVLEQIGNSNKRRVLTGVPAGFKFTADTAADGFNKLTLTSPAAQTIQIAVGDDDVTFSNSVTVSGNVTTQDLPAGTLADKPVVACGNAAQTAVVPVNGARRRVMLSVDPAAGGVVYARSTAGANNLVPMQPGMSYTFSGTYGVDVRNDTGAAVNIYVAEES